MEHADRAARQGANLARHLNQAYPDTVLFLARHGAGRPDATAAELRSVTATELLLQISNPGGTETVAVPLPTNTVPHGEARARIRELIRLTRERAPRAPMTSLETQMSDGRHPHDHR